jgi:hypothetical protein
MRRFFSGSSFSFRVFSWLISQKSAKSQKLET